MDNIVLISCVSKKLPYNAKAKDLYVSSLFKYALKYAYKLNPDRIFILSAKYGLLELDDEIEPYDQTLNNMSGSEAKIWASMVLKQLSSKTDMIHSEYVFLAGEKYRKFLIPEIKHFKIPLQGLSIGRQLQKLKELTSRESE